MLHKLFLFYLKRDSSQSTCISKLAIENAKYFPKYIYLFRAAILEHLLDFIWLSNECIGVAAKQYSLQGKT